MLSKKAFAFLAVLVTMFAIGTATPASAAPTSTTTGTFILDAKGFVTRSDVATLWANAGVPIVVGTCDITNPYCIHATVGNLACGTAGCATYGTQGCEIQVAKIAMHVKRSGNAGYDTQFNVLGHEVGHCILHNSWHATDSNDIMVGWVSLGLPRRAILQETRDQLALAGY